MVEYRQRKAAERAADKGELHRLQEELNTANSRVENLVKKHADEVKGLNTLLETSAGNVQKLVEELEAMQRKADESSKQARSNFDRMNAYNTRAEHTERIAATVGMKAVRWAAFSMTASAIIVSGLAMIAGRQRSRLSDDIAKEKSLTQQYRTMYEDSQAELARWKTEGMPEENTRLQVVTYAYLDSGVWKSFDDGRPLTVTAWRAND